jgi:hypothetical protein
MAQEPQGRQTADNKSVHDVENQAAISEVPDDPIQPDDGTPEYTELVLLVHAGNMIEAELFKAELEAHGIPTLLQGEGAGVAGIPDVGAGVPILVPEELANQAAELIAELESARPDELAFDDDEILDERVGELEDIDDDDVSELDSLDNDLRDDDDEDDSDDDWDDDEDDEEENDDEDDDDWDDDEDDDDR